MSDRRTIVLVSALLAALLGLVIATVAAISLQDPFTVSGETGTRTDVGRELVAAVVIGGLLVVGGVGTAVGLVRAQLRDVPS